MRTFRAIIARESVETDEGRMTRVFPAGCFEWGDGPWPATIMHEDMALNGTVLGRCDRIERLGDLILAYGVLDDEGTGEAADLRRDVIRQIDGRMINAISVEAAGLDVEEECTAVDDDGFCEAMRFTFTRYRIGAMSLVTIPAIDGTLIELDPSEPDETPDIQAAVASAARPGRVYPDIVVPAAWLTEPDDLPDLDAPGSRTPVVTAEGRVYGWVCSWQDCLTHIETYCQTPWRSPSNFAYAMHSGPFITDTGEEVTLAPLAVTGGHFPTDPANARDWQGALRRYDDPDTVGAYVAYGQNDRGIWFSGVVSPEADERRVAMMARHQVSADYRRPFGVWEFMGACSVNQPGFVRRAAWAASADGTLELVAAIVASGAPVRAACSCGGSCGECSTGAHQPEGDDAPATLERLLTDVRDLLAADRHDVDARLAGDALASSAAHAVADVGTEARLAAIEAQVRIITEFLEPSLRESLRVRLAG